jgi:aryl-alcohol dehydrogenase-like predicted oxidoreductase
MALGTMTWGRDTDEHESADQLKAYLEAGGNFLDTAASFTDGDAERVLGSLIGNLVKREDLVIATKAGVVRRSDELVADTSRRALLEQLDGSLERLGVSCVDLWQLHTWSVTAPLEESLAAVDVAVSSGRARYAGVSNYSGWQLARAVTHQQAWPQRAPLIAAQMEYSLVQRGVEREVVPAAQALGLGLLPWSPLGRGVLSGKYRTGTPADSRAASPHLAAFVEHYLDDRSRRVVDAVVTAADGLGASPVEIALAWVRDRPGVVAPVVGARTAAQLRGSLTAEHITLPAEIRQALDDVSAPAIGYPDAAR